MAVDCCYISAFTIGDSSACAATLRDNSPDVVGGNGSMSTFLLLPKGAARLLERILQEMGFVCETRLWLSAPAPGLSEKLGLPLHPWNVPGWLGWGLERSGMVRG